MLTIYFWPFQIPVSGISVQGFPTLMLFTAESGAEPVSFEGEREVADLVSFVNESRKWEDYSSSIYIVFSFLLFLHIFTSPAIGLATFLQKKHSHLICSGLLMPRRSRTPPRMLRSSKSCLNVFCITYSGPSALLCYRTTIGGWGRNDVEM